MTTSQKYRRSDSLPFAFTEQGVAMLSSVLRSSRAVEVNIAIMRTFVQLRRLMDSNADLSRKIERVIRLPRRSLGKGGSFGIPLSPP